MRHLRTMSIFTPEARFLFVHFPGLFVEGVVVVLPLVEPDEPFVPELLSEVEEEDPLLLEDADVVEALGSAEELVDEVPLVGTPVEETTITTLAPVELAFVETEGTEPLAVTEPTVVGCTETLLIAEAL